MIEIYRRIWLWVWRLLEQVAPPDGLIHGRAYRAACGAFRHATTSDPHVITCPECRFHSRGHVCEECAQHAARGGCGKTEPYVTANDRWVTCRECWNILLKNGRGG